jgi:3-oxoacyl-(acyl-carrier-protein) reductase
MSTDRSVSTVQELGLHGFSLVGKKAYVTGGSRGIGAAVAMALASAGADVAIGCNSESRSVEEVCEAIRDGGRRAEYFPHDVSRPGEVTRACDEVLKAFDGIDILVNNAGITRDRSFKKMVASDWDEVIATNLSSVFHVTKQFIDGMAERDWGRVINISSVVGKIGNFGQANYAAAKAGMIGLTKTLAREYSRKGITVNAVAPGFIRTRMVDAIPEKAIETVLAMTPVGRLGDPADVASAVLYLASPAAGFVTGQVLDVNGGLAM